jgi:hypothetical protein
VAIAVGGAVLGFFKFLSGSTAPAAEIFTYGIGLFFGFCGLAIVDWWMRGYHPERADPILDSNPVQVLRLVVAAAQPDGLRLIK